MSDPNARIDLQNRKTRDKWRKLSLETRRRATEFFVNNRSAEVVEFKAHDADIRGSKKDELALIAEITLHRDDKRARGPKPRVVGRREG